MINNPKFIQRVQLFRLLRTNSLMEKYVKDGFYQRG